MQITLANPARPERAMLFARRTGRDYMMRSEKRPSQSSGQIPPNPNRRRRRRKAGFFYILITLLLSVALWPVGMIMLWRRKVRWHATTKLLTSIVTLVLCLTLLTFGLTVQTENARFTKIQDSVNDFLNNSVEYVGTAFGTVMEKGDQLWASSADLGDALGRACMIGAADTLDAAAQYGAIAREYIVGLFGAEEAEPPVEATEVPGSDNAALTTLKPTAKPAVTPTAEPSPTPEAKPEVPGEGELPLTVPAATPDVESATPIGNGVLNRDGTFSTAEPTTEPTVEPTATVNAEGIVAVTEAPTATPTPEPTPDPSLAPKAAGEAVVYYNSNGRFYHLKSSCVGMTNADEHTLAEAAADGKNRCNRCMTTDISILEAENVVWTDDAQMFHLSDACTAFTGDWALMTIEDALETMAPCKSCKADQFVLLCGLKIPEPTAVPTAEPTAVPTATPVPAPEAVTPSATVKPAAEAMLYHSSNGGWYHTQPNCSGMGGASLYPLSDCVEDGFQRCRKCEAPQPGLLDELCLWQDNAELCHTSDECPAFDGGWTLIIRDEALESGLTGCKVCGADEYLVPNTIIAAE